MKFDYATNGDIVDAMEAYAYFVTYRDKCKLHNISWANTDKKAAGFVINIWELSRKADELIKKAGIEGITTDKWLWAGAVDRHIEAGHFDHCNMDHIKELLAKDEAR
jgi:hypothetical protein